jgi:hypothetical protein
MDSSVTPSFSNISGVLMGKDALNTQLPTVKPLSDLDFRNKYKELTNKYFKQNWQEPEFSYGTGGGIGNTREAVERDRFKARQKSEYMALKELAGTSEKASRLFEKKYMPYGVGVSAGTSYGGSQQALDQSGLMNAQQDIMEVLQGESEAQFKNWQEQQQKTAEEKARQEGLESLKRMTNSKDSSFDAAYQSGSRAKDIVAQKGKIDATTYGNVFENIFKGKTLGASKKGEDTGSMLTASWLGGLINPENIAQKASGLSMQERLGPATQKLAYGGQTPVRMTGGYFVKPFSSSLEIERKKFTEPEKIKLPTQVQTTQKLKLPAKTGIGKYI